LKLWKTRRAIDVKTFALELLTTGILEDKASLTLPNQLKRVWMKFRDNMDSLSIADPANSNNDLSEMLSDRGRRELQSHARETLRAIEDGGWKVVFGEVINVAANATKIEALRRIATSPAAPAKPWRGGA